MKILNILTESEKTALVVAGFPGIGKSYFKKNNDDQILDSDSSLFSWEKGKENEKRNPDFPENYIQHIKSNLNKADIILVSTHDEVREELEKNNIKYLLVYPDIKLKNEYIERYKKRGSEDKFIKFITDNWDTMIKNLKKEKYPEHYVLKQDEFLSDAIENKNGE